MIGLRIGPAIGLAAALAAGIDANQLSPVAQGGGATTTLTVALTDSADPVITAVGFSYALAVTNTGAIDATSVTASVTLDASLTYGSASGTGWAVDASALPVVTFTRAMLAVGVAPTITINVTSGGAATTAISTANASASNASAAAPSIQTTTVALVSKDASSGIRVPANAAEWASLIAYYGLGISTPNSLWLCQEASGNLADSIGALTLAAAGSPTYANAVSGWTRAGVGTTEATANRFSAPAGSGPDPSLSSSLWIFFVNTPAASTGNRMMMTAGGAVATTDVSLFVTGATGKPFVRCVNVSVNGNSVVFSMTQPYALAYNRTAGTVKAYSGQEKIVGTYSAGATDGNKGIGAAFSLSSADVYVYGLMFSGAVAEMTDAQIKSLLTALGWAIPWS